MGRHSCLHPPLLAALCFSLCSCGGQDQDVLVQGSGATFPSPVYKRWFLEYYQTHPEVRVNYQAIGSGAGVRQFDEGICEFGATDAYLVPDKVPAFLLPMTAGSVAICYNLPGAPSELKLTRRVYVDIFLGKIANWNHADIAAANPGVELPGTPITVVRRSDASGTTYAFTNHLNAISDKWAKEGGGPGKGKFIEWPTGLAARGNSGVTATIKITPGAIGYLETGYATLAKLAIARLENKEGRFVGPDPLSARLAVSGVNLKLPPEPDNYFIEIPDSAGAESYPIVTYTWIVVRREYSGKFERSGRALVDVLRYCLADGQRLCQELDYIPLPQNLVDRVLTTVDKVQIGGIRDQKSEIRGQRPDLYLFTSDP